MGNSQADISRDSEKGLFSPLGRDTTSAELTEAIERLIAGKTFSRSGQLKRLLAYFRDCGDSTDLSVWSETCIGANVFGRKDFNPKLDTIVRVEMRRLRQKLDEFYSGEGAALQFRLRFEKNTYRPYLEPNIQQITIQQIADAPTVAPTGVPSPVEPAPPPPASRFWAGVSYGAGSLLLLILAGATVWWTFFGSTNKPRRELAESPIWTGFGSSNVVVALGTPLFFRSAFTIERNFGLNFPEDLRAVDQFQLHKPAYPLWNSWATFEDVAAAVNLDRFLHSLNSTSTVVPARQLSVAGLAGRRTILMGPPRCAPLLIDLLAEENFRPPTHADGKLFVGFINADPKPGELRRFPLPPGNFMMESDESNPDYALLTSIHLSNGGEVLSVFGDRSQTGAYLTHKLTDPAFVSELNNRIFGHSRPGALGSAYQSVQIVYRVDYSHGVATGLVYVTHRIRLAGKK